MEEELVDCITNSDLFTVWQITRMVLVSPKKDG